MAAAEPKNAASEWLRAAFAYVNQLDHAPTAVRANITDDFTYENRRSGSLLPDGDAEMWSRSIESIWETGSGLPQHFVREVVAVRGENLAAVRGQIEYGNGFVLESIQVMELDATLTRLRRTVDFDFDDVDGAIAELDRLHSQSDPT